MDNTVAHKLRLQNKRQSHQNIKDIATRIVMQYINEHRLSLLKETKLSEHYQAINELLEERFNTAHQYYLARKVFLECIRGFNKKHGIHLDEPVLPVLAERDDLTIGYDWFVKGTQVADSTQIMLDIWKNKRKFTANNLIEGALYCSIVYGGLNDIEGLRAFYDWLLSKRSLNYIEIDSEHPDDTMESGNPQKVAIILLTIKDKNYGYKPANKNVDEVLERYLNYIPDDMTLSFIYALSNRSISSKNIRLFNTVIKNLSKKLGLEQKDIEKPHLSQLFRYANYNWRQTEECSIDGALSVVMQGQAKTTALPSLKTLSYNREIILKNRELLTWNDLLLIDYSSTKENRAEPKDYPAFSKNLVKSLQDALKGTRANAISTVDKLLVEFNQPNGQRLLSWTAELLLDNSKRLETVSKYLGCIGRDWLMLTMNESLDNWEDEDFESIYEQIICSKIKDGRKNSLLKKDSEFVDDKLGLENVVKIEDELSDVQYIDTNTRSKFDQVKDTQKFTYGRLRDFHEFQRKHFDAPYVYFPWGNSRQVIKANIVSPKVYKAMQDDIKMSKLDAQQKRLCLVILSLAYRSGMRLRELIGIQLNDIADMYDSWLGQLVEQPVIWLRPNRYRRLKSDSAKRCVPIHCLLKSEELKNFVSLFQEQKRLKRRYLFSLGSGNHPLPVTFFSNLVKQLWDRTLGKHDFTFHSLRHTAISQLALVLKQSSLVQVMTDYDSLHCKNIIKGVLVSNQTQGTWFGLASLAGHLTCDTTFEYYIHTAHFLAGEQVSRSKLELPLTVFEMMTDIDYQTVHRQNKDAYNASTKRVSLYRLRDYLVKKLTSKADELFADSSNIAEKKLSCQPISTTNLVGIAVPEKSIYIHARYDDVIAFLEELQKINPLDRDSKLAETALRHAIHIKQAEIIHRKAGTIFENDRLLLSSPRDKFNEEVLFKALTRAYQMSISDSDALLSYMQIFASKQNLKTSSIHFGKKDCEQQKLRRFLEVGCQLIDASHWQIRSNTEDAVTDLKREFGLDNRIRTGARKNYKGFEVRVVQKKHKHSENNLAFSDEYLASSGVLKYLGYFLMAVLV